MKAAFITVLTFFSLGRLQAQTFTRDLPSKHTLEVLTTQNFPNMDAVIILNEQSYVVQNSVGYIFGVPFRVPRTSESRVLIVKVFDDVAVKEYADNEFYFNAYSVTGDKAPFYARARVLKPDGSVHVMPQDDIRKVAFLKASDGTPLIYKVIVKIPDVAPGDVIQYEYFHETNDLIDIQAARNLGALFYYNYGDLCFYSNLYVTVPEAFATRFYNFPDQLIGKPKIVKQATSSGGDEVTYFWSVTNLGGIPDEPYCLPFEETSALTAFAFGPSEKDFTWNRLADDYKINYIADTRNSSDDLAKLGMAEREAGTVMSFSTLDTLYTKLRKYFVLSELHDVFPHAQGLGNDFDTKKADASDLALIMYDILGHWGVEAHPVWIRDEREGDFEKSVPILAWFDRLGVLATVNGKNMLYDFDWSIPTHYETPWFLQNATVMVLGDDSCYQWPVMNSEPYQPNLSYEKHLMTFSDDRDIHDSMILEYKGRPAEDLRDRFYSSDSETVADHFRDDFAKSLFSAAPSVGINDYLDQMQFAVSASGVSSATTQSIDSLIVVSPNDFNLSGFRKKFLSSVRHDYIDFGVPLSFRVEFMIAIPPGYAYLDTLKDQSVTGPADASAFSTSQVVAGNVDDVTSVDFPLRYIRSSDYKEFVSFLDKAVALVKRSVVLRKGK